MKIEKQVASFELSKRLKELGFSQSGYFYWEVGLDGKPLLVKSYIASEGDKPRLFSAFTVAELGEMLPWSVHRKSEMPYSLKMIKTIETVDDDEFQVAYFRGEEKLRMFFDRVEANARAKMLIYLYEEKLI